MNHQRQCRTPVRVENGDSGCTSLQVRHVETLVGEKLCRTLSPGEVCEELCVSLLALADIALAADKDDDARKMFRPLAELCMRARELQRSIAA
jgi:hypothetical protein